MGLEVDFRCWTDMINSGEWVAHPPGTTHSRVCVRFKEVEPIPETASVRWLYRLVLATAIIGGVAAVIKFLYLITAVFLIPGLCPSSTVTTSFKPITQQSIALSTTASQLTTLQDSLYSRMSQHQTIMDSNLDNFTATLTCLTTDADLAISYAQFIQNLLPLSPGSTAQEWQNNADLLIAEAEKLSKLALSEDARQNIEAVTQIAASIAAELADMEVFMQSTNNATSSMLERMSMMLQEQDGSGSTSGGQLQPGSCEAEIARVNEPIAEAAEKPRYHILLG